MAKCSRPVQQFFFFFFQFSSTHAVESTGDFTTYGVRVISYHQGAGNGRPAVVFLEFDFWDYPMTPT